MPYQNKAHTKEKRNACKTISKAWPVVVNFLVVVLMHENAVKYSISKPWCPQTSRALDEIFKPIKELDQKISDKSERQEAR